MLYNALCHFVVTCTKTRAGIGFWQNVVTCGNLTKCGYMQANWPPMRLYKNVVRCGQIICQTLRGKCRFPYCVELRNKAKFDVASFYGFLYICLAFSGYHVTTNGLKPTPRAGLVGYPQVTTSYHVGLSDFSKPTSGVAFSVCNPP